MLQKGIVKILVALFALQALGNLYVPAAKAAATCNASTQFNIESKTNSVFYFDDGTTIKSGYAQFKITNKTGSAISGYYAQLEGMPTSGLKLADNELSKHEIFGSLANNSSVNLYWYLTALSPKVSSAQNFKIVIYNSSNTAICEVSKSFTKTDSTIAASANKVTSVSNDALPASPDPNGGAVFTSTVKGQTGTIGQGPTGTYDVNLTPSTNEFFSAKNYRLSGTTYKCVNASGATIAGTLVTDSLYIPNACEGNYVATFTYQYLSVATGGEKKLSPIMQISSGTQMKHTTPPSFTIVAFDAVASPQVTTQNASNLIGSSARFNGSIDVGTFSDLYFCKSTTNPGASFAGSCTDTVTANSGSPYYTADLTNLSAGTYYFEFFGLSGSQYYYGGVKSFTVVSQQAGVYDTTTAATSVTTDSARINGQQTGLASANVSADTYFIFSTSYSGSGHLDPSNDDTITATAVNSDKLAFYADLSALNSGTKYYFELVLVDAATASYYGGVLNFTTLVTVTFDPNSGTLASGNTTDTATASVGADALSSKPVTNPSRSGYTFIGWNTNSSATSALSTHTLSGNVTLYAIWQAVSSSGGGGGGAPASNPPTISSISAAEVCAVGAQLTIKGSNLSGATVTVNNATARVISSSSSELVVALPDALPGDKTIKVTNSDGSATTTVRYTFIERPVYANVTYPEMYKDLAFSYTFSATDAKSYSIIGTLPAGLSLNPLTGEISGTPTVSGDFTFTIVANNICASAYLNVYMFIDKAIPEAFTCTVSFNVRNSDAISEIKLNALRNCLEKVLKQGPTSIDPVIFLSGGVPSGLSVEELLNHPRYAQICELMNSMGIIAQIFVGVFEGPLDQVQIMVYWPEPLDV